jgi:hypothetical protein
MNFQFLYGRILLFILLVVSSVSFTVGVLSFENIWKRKHIGAKAIKLHRIFWIFFMFLMGITYGIYIIYPEKFYYNDLMQKCLYIFTIGMVTYGILGFTLRTHIAKKSHY